MTGVNTVSGDEHGSDKKIHGDIVLSKVKAPNMFERAKEEFDAVIGVIHQHKSSRNESVKMELKSEKTEDVKRKRDVIRKAKEEIKSLFHSKEKPHGHHHHRKEESHTRSDDIDENTQVDEEKAPNVSERVKEEIETVVVIDTIHPEENEVDGSDSPKGSRSVSLEKERAGLGCSLGKWLEKICAPWGDTKKD
ncbi:DEAD-box ATP-dependent RNA helicase [Hirschfeldia incana]|nr:DEAD-box ATP-dependent RNA helicase [Hirschfeldia incana]